MVKWSGMVLARKLESEQGNIAVLQRSSHMMAAWIRVEYGRWDQLCAVG